MLSQYADVIVRHVTDLEEVVVTVLESASIKEIKEILAERVERPELTEVGEISRILPDGSTAPLKETSKVGAKRLLGFKGCPLHPPPPELPPPSLEDFAEFDPEEEIIGSPRSVRACMLEGVAPEDLMYVPLESFALPNIEPRIGQLWYDFFEAIRQDGLQACRESRRLLIAEELGHIDALLQEDARIAGTGGNWCGVLEHSRYDKVYQFFREQNEMCHIDRIYRNATVPYRPNLKSAFFTDSVSFNDDDPVLAGDTSDDAAWKLNTLLKYYNSIPGSRKHVEEQRLVTKANGVAQYEQNTKKLHRDQKELRRLHDKRIETAETQINIADCDILDTTEIRHNMENRLHEAQMGGSKLKEPVDIGDRVTIHSMAEEMARMNGRSGKVVDEGRHEGQLLVRLPKPRGFLEVAFSRDNLMHTELARQVAIKERAVFFAARREYIHERQLNSEFDRCEKMKEIMLHDQAVEERVHQHKSLRKLAFAREWTKRRVRWQLKNNSLVSNRNERNQAILNKHQAATDRVETQHLIRQKCIEYKREIKSLMRLHADLAAKREKARQGARRDALASELSHLSLEADPSPSPLRRHTGLARSLGSNADTAPFSNLLNKPRVMKRQARFDFPRMGAGFMSNSLMSASTGSGGSWMRQSNSMPSIGSSTGGDQRAIAYF